MPYSPAPKLALLAQVHYGNDLADNIFTTTSTTSVDVDATNAAITFTVPSTGKVIVRVTAVAYLSASATMYWQLRESTTVLQEGIVTSNTIGVALARTFRVTGLTPGASKTYKLGWRVSASTGNMIYGTTRGGITIEVFEAP